MAGVTTGRIPSGLKNSYERFLKRYPHMTKGFEMRQVQQMEMTPVADPPKGYRSVATGCYPNMTEKFVGERRRRIAASVARGFMPRIEVGSPDMTCFFGGAVDYYQPTFGGSAMAFEGGDGPNSLDNLREIADVLGPPIYVKAHYGKQFLFWFSGSQTYVATGFGLGYSGEGPAALAEILVEFGDGDKTRKAVMKMRSHLRYKFEVDFSGMIYRYLGRRETQLKKTWVVGAVMGPHGSVL